MTKFISTALIFAVFTTLAFSQNLTQTVRGTIIDSDNKLPLIGATVIIIGTDPLIGTATDGNVKTTAWKFPSKGFLTGISTF
jgi:hypothetical protein